MSEKNKLASYRILQELKKNETFLMMNDSQTQFISKIIEILPDSDQFLCDLSSTHPKNIRSPGTEELTFIGEPLGKKIEFKCNFVGTTTLHSITVFICEVPKHISVTQSREFFRVKIPALATYFCSGILADNTKFNYTIADVSIGGVSLYTDDAALRIEEGDIVYGAVINFDQFGVFSSDLRYIRKIKKILPDSSGRSVTRQLLSFSFINLESIKQREIERLVLELQQEQAVQARRFQMPV